jgi:hypothetical protein
MNEEMREEPIDEDPIVDPVRPIEPIEPPEPPEPPVGDEELDGGVESIRTIFNSVTDEELSDEALRAYLEFIGYPTANMTLQNIHDFFEDHGVSSGLLGDGTPEGICTIVAEGHPVVISGDKGEMSGTDDPYEDWIFGEDADRAFVVREVDFSDPDNPTVTLYALDGSSAEGVTVPLSVFLDAWGDGGNDYLVPGLTEEEVSELLSSEESPIESMRARASDA